MISLVTRNTLHYRVLRPSLLTATERNEDNARNLALFLRNVAAAAIEMM